MKVILHEIRRQPLWARELMFAFSVISTVSVVGMVWFGSFQQNIYALNHPGENIEDQRFFAEGEEDRTTLNAVISSGMALLKDGVYGVLNLEKEDVDSTPKAVYPMPIAKDRN